MNYKKGDVVTLMDNNNKRQAKVTVNGIDSKGKVRVRPNGFPMDISVSTEKNNNVYILT
tara:strand:+ start:334 stop:510 length:177 start_codon:yes stop_codon:yes gene_type:complete